MRFFHSRIVNPVGGGIPFDEWVSNYLKTASEATPECSDGDPRSQCEGQVINNDNEDGANSYQEGESVTGKAKSAEADECMCGKDDCTECSVNKETETDDEVETKEASCGKEMGESNDAGKVTEEHTDAAPGDDKSDVKTKINNDPNYQKGESSDPGKVDGKNKKQPGEPVATGKGKKAHSKTKFKKVAMMNRQERLAIFAKLSSDSKNPMLYVESMSGIKYANMTEEEQSWFKEFWNILYPEGYVNSMVANR